MLKIASITASITFVIFFTTLLLCGVSIGYLFGVSALMTALFTSMACFGYEFTR